MRGGRLVAVVLTAVVAAGLPAEEGAAATAPACTSASPSPKTAPLTDAVAAEQAPGPVAEKTWIHWTRWSTRVVHGDPAVLEGQVVTEDGALARATVDLLERRAGTSGWSEVASATADPETGVFSFDCLRPTVTTEYQVVYGGTLLHGPSRAARTVGVARRVPDTMRKVAADRFVLAGSVQPRYVGQPVVLQRKSCADCRWRAVRTRETTNRSRWRFAIDSSSFTRRQWFRAVVPADKGYVRSYGDHVWRIG
ncbi:MAG TPA: hypothetical protein VFZ64_04915 [Nocardioidaceae bacterium]